MIAPRRQNALTLDHMLYINTVTSSIEIHTYYFECLPPFHLVLTLPRLSILSILAPKDPRSSPYLHSSLLFVLVSLLLCLLPFLDPEGSASPQYLLCFIKIKLFLLLFCFSCFPINIEPDCFSCFASVLFLVLSY
jgi:hypothetical protein